MTPKDATDEEIKAAIEEAELAADGYAWHTKTDVMVATALKRGQAIERARLCKELTAWAHKNCNDLPDRLVEGYWTALTRLREKLKELEAA